MILLNGQLSEEILISDRGLQYGDGCFTTILVQHGEVSMWARHDQRLRSNTSRLGILSVDWNSMFQWVQYVANSLKHEEKAIIKVVITRGSGGRGYSPVGCHSPNILVSTHTYPIHYKKWRKEGICMVLLEQRLGISPLAGIKHLNRLEQVMLKREVDERGSDDGIACDMQGHLVETSASNVFWRKGNTLYTPDLQQAGVYGTMRAQVIDIAVELGFDVQEVSQGPEVLWDADEVFITNAVMGLIPVRRIEKTNYSAFDACKAITLRLTA